MCEWPVSPLEEVSICYNRRRIPVKAPDRKPGPYPYYGASGIVDHVDNYLFDGEYVLVAEDGGNLRSRKLPIALLATGKFWVNNHAHVFQGNHKASTRFLAYALQMCDVEPFLTGTTIPKLSLRNVLRVPIPVPPRGVQDVIVGLLSSLDERITIVRQSNALLESIAQAIFKSWFIDFDPVHAKAEGREPEGMDEDTAALFPSEFEDSELGPIPKGWQPGIIRDIAQNMRQQVDPRQLYERTPYIGLEHMPRGSIALDTWGDAKGLQSAKLKFQTNDILFGRLRPYFHKVGIAPCDGICSTDILVLQPISREFHGILTMYVSSRSLIDYATRLSTGARMPRASWKDIAAYPIVVPTHDIAREYQRITNPFFDRIMANVKQIQTLSSLRDTLLPRLISGKLRIPEAEEIVQEAVS